MAGEKVPATSGNPLTDLANLLTTVAGTRTSQTVTSSPGDTAALQDVLSQLKGADYTAMLDSIMQKAGTAIPGMQATYGRAAGFRGSNNAGLAAAMQQLLKETTMAAQEKIVAQQQANQQIQAQAGQAIAQATKGTTQTTSAKSGMDLNKAIALLALAQGVSKLGGMDIGKQLSGLFTTSGGGTSVGGGAPSVPIAAAATPMAAPAAATMGTVMPSPAESTMQPTQSWPMRDFVTALTNPVMAVTNFLSSLGQGSSGSSGSGMSFATPEIVEETPQPTSGLGQGIVDFIQRNAFKGPAISLDPTVPAPVYIPPRMPPSGMDAYTGI